MANIADLANDVYIITNRPDLVAETGYALRAATRKFHNADFFQQDSRKLTLAVTSLGNQRYSVDFTEPNFVRPRAIQAVSYVSANHCPIPAIQPDDLLDRYATELPEYWFLSGQVITVRTPYEPAALVIDYYAHPFIGQEVINSWIADQYPDFIIEEAAANVFRQIGKDEEAQRYNALFAQNRITLQMVGATSSVS